MTAAAVAYVGGKYLVETNMLGNGYAATFLLAFILTAAGLTFLYLVREPDAPSVASRRSASANGSADIPGMLRDDRAFAMYFWAQTLATLGTLAMPFYILFVGQDAGADRRGDCHVVAGAAGVADGRESGVGRACGPAGI